MALTREAIPYGLRDVKVAPLDAAGVPEALVDLPNSQTLEFSETEEFQVLRGDDREVARRGSGPVVEWSLESGGISLEAYTVLAGGALVLSGVAPAEIKTYTKLDTDSRPYFYMEGRALSESGGDFHVRFYRSIADDTLEGSLTDQEFWISSAGGHALGSADPANEFKSYELIQNETEAEIAVV